MYTVGDLPSRVIFTLVTVLNKGGYFSDFVRHLL